MPMPCTPTGSPKQQKPRDIVGMEEVDLPFLFRERKYPVEARENMRKMFELQLRAHGDADTRSSKIADHVREYAKTFPPTEIQSLAWSFSNVVGNLAFDTPSDHPWHDIIAATVNNLQTTGGPIGPSETYKWENLPTLGMWLLDFWVDPSGNELAVWDAEEEGQWKSINSFAAKTMTHTFSGWLNFSELALDRAFGPEDLLHNRIPGSEKKEGRALRCLIWVATEWLLRSPPDLIYDWFFEPFRLEEMPELTIEHRLDILRSYHTKLLGFLRNKEDLGLDDELVERMEKVEPEMASKIAELCHRFASTQPTAKVNGQTTTTNGGAERVATVASEKASTDVGAQHLPDPSQPAETRNE